MEKTIEVWACPYCERVTNDPIGPCIRCETPLVRTTAKIELPEMSSSERNRAEQYGNRNTGTGQTSSIT